MNIKSLIDRTSGYKTYIAGAGLFALAFYQLTQGDYPTAYQTGMAALAVVGVRGAISKAATPGPGKPAPPSEPAP